MSAIDHIARHVHRDRAKQAGVLFDAHVPGCARHMPNK